MNGSTRSVYRHAVPTRLGHWLSALCLLAMRGQVLHCDIRPIATERKSPIA